MIQRLAHPVSSDPHRGPVLEFGGLDVLWIQVGGTLCNIACTHCFISCGPKNDSHPMMRRDEVQALLERAETLGVKEYYFTGGEPFLHDEIEALIADVLRQGPLSILTNALLIDDARASRLAWMAESSPFGLDLRVSIDGLDATENDPSRGRGSFDKILAGARHLNDHGLNPVFTVTTVHAKYAASRGRGEFMQHLRHLGFERPRVKFIPPFRIGREERRDEAYCDEHRLGPQDLLAGGENALQCGSCRAVTARGVYPCPILIEEDGARMGAALEEGLRPIALNHPACKSCHQEGFSCRT
jgi:MoaA/NifB/PqqE/SkfB family radical SAM enzyme